MEIFFFVVAKIKYLWIASLMCFFLAASQIGFLGFFPAILELRGIEPGAAGMIAAMTSLFMIPSSLIVPKASNSAGLRKAVLWISSIIAGVTLYFMGTSVDFPLWASIVAYGFLSGGMTALVLSMPAELVDPSCAATAGGLLLMIGYSGAILGPWLAGFLTTMTESFGPSILACVVLTEVNVVLALTLKQRGS